MHDLCFLEFQSLHLDQPPISQPWLGIVAGARLLRRPREVEIIADDLPHRQARTGEVARLGFGLQAGVQLAISTAWRPLHCCACPAPQA